MENDFMQILDGGVSKAVDQIAKMPIATAEKVIDDIAGRKGDEFAKKILGNLTPVKIAVILRQHDFSCPSIISWILSPAVIVNILRFDPLFWKNIHDEGKAANFYQI